MTRHTWSTKAKQATKACVRCGLVRVVVYDAPKKRFRFGYGELRQATPSDCPGVRR